MNIIGRTNSAMTNTRSRNPMTFNEMADFLQITPGGMGTRNCLSARRMCPEQLPIPSAPIHDFIRSRLGCFAVVASDYAGLGVTTLSNGEQLHWLVGLARARDVAYSVESA
jgi:hypothetical protein